MTQRRSLQAYLERGRAKYGEQFNPALAKQFIPYFESGERVRVRFASGMELTGTIGITTGWIPCFLLMRRSSDVGSMWTLSERDEIVAVQRGRKYIEVS